MKKLYLGAVSPLIAMWAGFFTCSLTWDCPFWVWLGTFFTTLCVLGVTIAIAVVSVTDLVEYHTERRDGLRRSKELKARMAARS